MARASHNDEAVDEQVEQVLELLRSRGGRITTSRRLLLHCLFEATSHLTAEDVAEQVQKKAPDVHLSTIYRNLEELEQLGVLTHAHLGHGPATYHLMTKAHGHFVCENCSQTFDATDEMFSTLAREAFDRFGFVIDPHHFAVLGRCPKCAKAANDHVATQRSGAPAK